MIWGARRTRSALVYVLANGAKHREIEAGELDPRSSAKWFTGCINPLPPPDEPNPAEPPGTWLLDTGWSESFPGFIFPSEVPKAARG